MIIKQYQGSANEKLYALEGVIDENVDFPKTELAAEAGDLNVDLFLITRINSMGVKRWMSFFNELKRTSKKFNFFRVSPALVEQLNQISNFRCGGNVVSVVLPYFCGACRKQTYLVKKKDEVNGVDLESIAPVCQHCGKGDLEFDDIPEDYLKFWK